jgi:uncharacterized membrane protein YbhN (UPF0104 family)
VRRGLLAGAALTTVVGSYLAVQHIGLQRIGDALVRSSPAWVLVALALMCASMLLRAVSWHAILKAAMPDARPRMVDAVQGITIGVLMSATLPARLGEPSRALVVARRLGRARERLPVVLGTLVSQTLINVFALVILGAVMFITIGLFAGKQQALLWYALAPIGLLVVVLVAGSVAVTVAVLVTVSLLLSGVVLSTELESVGASDDGAGVLIGVSGVPAEPPPSTLRPPLLPPESGVPLTASIPVIVSNARAQAATAPSAAAAHRGSRFSPPTPPVRV